MSWLEIIPLLITTNDVLKGDRLDFYNNGVGTGKVPVEMAELSGHEEGIVPSKYFGERVEWVYTQVPQDRLAHLHDEPWLKSQSSFHGLVYGWSTLGYLQGIIGKSLWEARLSGHFIYHCNDFREDEMEDIYKLSW